MEFDSVFPDYQKIINTAQITSAGGKQAKEIARSVMANYEKYASIQNLTWIPWDFVAALHWLECSGDFTQHLANGDPIAKPTAHEPVGIPTGSWEDCAIAALRLKKLVGRADLEWTLLHKLWRAEKWNGWGYRQHHPEVNSPYLWSGTTAYTKGKYVADGKWNRDAISKQCGIYLILLELQKYENVPNNKMNIPTIAPSDDARFVTFTSNSFLKAAPLPAADLASDQKQAVLKSTSYRVYSQLPDINNHYQLQLDQSNSDLFYIYKDHAGLDNPAEASPAPKNEKLSLQGIQENLIRIGLLDPPADGKLGAQTRSAIRAFNRLVHGADEGDTITDIAANKLLSWRSAKSLDFAPKDPQNQEDLLAVKCIQRMIALGAHVAISMGSASPTYNICHLTGHNPDGTKNSNRLDRWNDLRFVVKVNQDGVVEAVLCKLATCEPGRHWLDNPMNSAGTFRIKYDKQFFAWCVGRHGSKQYPALVQVSEIEGYRDSDGNDSWDNEKLVVGIYGVNIHHGYNSAQVGIMSAGCQVAKSIDGHEQFMELIKADRRYLCNNGYQFANISLDGNNFA